jgi:hypothetical protein
MEPSVDGPWSIGEPAFAEIVRDMTGLAPSVIVEFGSGASSVRLAKAFPAARILSVEHDEHFLERSRALADQYHIPPGRLDIELRRLRFRRIGAGIYQTYERGSFPADIDGVLIDGPPHWTQRGREACLLDVAAMLREGGRAYLDDYHRDQERRIVRNWMSRYTGVFRMWEVDVGHGICVLEKVAAAPPSPGFAPTVAMDTWLVFAKRCLRRAWNVLSRRERDVR